jgi:maltose/maltodextrin transport system permease protein
MTDTATLPNPSPVPRRLGVAVIALVLLYGAFHLYALGQPLFGAVLLALACGVVVIYWPDRFYGARFIFPGVAAVLTFIALPVGYTVYLGFTNYSSFNLLSFDRATQILLQRGTADPETEQPFAVAPDGSQYRIWLPDSGLLSDPVALTDPPTGPTTVALVPADPPETVLETRDAIRLRAGLQALTLTTPDGVSLVNAGLRTFAGVTPEYTQGPDGTLIRGSDGAVLTPDHDSGFYRDPAGAEVPPGWRVNIGWANFTRVFESDGIRQPLLSIFVWTMVFATASVFLTFAVGLTLAVILQWEHLRFKTFYRILLILPYAVPAFISILVFRGLFNQNFGELNLILEMLFGIRPSWFTDPWLAKIMILIVNTWLGYPYTMLLAMGFLQGVPDDHRKAAALEGASAARVFFTITLPQILPPFMPLLIASFAFNFNNMVLILLLTMGGPDRQGTLVPAGQTDILASFTYRMAFDDSATQFGLAGAITLMIFVVVALLSWANLAAGRRAARRNGGRA